MTDLRRLVDQGLPKRSLGQVAAYVSESPQEAARLRDRIVPPATYKRRSSALKPEESEKVERLARVAALAEAAFGSKEDALGFLHTPHPELGGETPLDSSRAELGARQVEEILWRMEHGLPL